MRCSDLSSDVGAFVLLRRRFGDVLSQVAWGSGALCGPATLRVRFGDVVSQVAWGSGFLCETATLRRRFGDVLSQVAWGSGPLCGPATLRRRLDDVVSQVAWGPGNPRDATARPDGSSDMVPRVPHLNRRVLLAPRPDGLDRKSTR